jgi:outer membrane protein W
MKTNRILRIVLYSVPFWGIGLTAQSLYVDVHAGYGFPAARQNLGGNTKSTTSGSVTTTENTSRSVSLGKGIQPGVAVGYMFTPNIGAEIGINYLLGTATKFVNEDTKPTSSDKSEISVKGSMIRIIPAVKFTISENKMRPYIRTGLIIGVATKALVSITDESVNGSTSSSSESAVEYSGGLSLGFHGAMGVNFMLSDNLGIFAEVTGYYQNWAPKKALQTKATLDGQDQLGTMDIRDKETDFEKSYTEDNSQPINKDVPSKSTQFWLPFSSAGLNVGVQINLGGGAKAKIISPAFD